MDIQNIIAFLEDFAGGHECLSQLAPHTDELTPLPRKLEGYRPLKMPDFFVPRLDLGHFERPFAGASVYSRSSTAPQARPPPNAVMV